MTIKRSEEVLFKDGSLNTKALISCLEEHKKTILRYEMLKDYYDGMHIILKREKNQKDLANNKLVVNHAEYITDMATGYFMGNPIKYMFPNADKTTDDDELLKAFRAANIDQIDTELSRDLSIFGIGIEYTYQDKEGKTKSTNLDPRSAFVVVDDTVEETELLGVHRIEKRDEDNSIIGEIIKVYTKDSVYTLEQDGDRFMEIDVEDNLFGEVPFIEFWNKSNLKSDYESVIPLIDAYNLLQSDRINDKEQFVDALLVLYGVLAGDNTTEKVETARALKEMGLLELPDGSRAEYISKTFHESDVELLKTSIVNDIHKISKVPNLTDENFAGNSSGVAMRYKLLGLEQLAQTKEGYYRIGLKKRIRLYSNILNIKNISVEVDEIQIQFTRSLPVNESEIAQLIMNLKGTVSQETLLSLLPFVDNVDTEIAKVEEEKKVNISTMQIAMGGYNVPDEDIEDEQE